MKPVKREARTWFGIEWYATVDEALMRDVHVRSEATSNPPTAELGRHPTYDMHDKVTHAPLFAVIVP